MRKPFRWKNCYADVLSSGYGQVAQSYVREVVEPSLLPLENQIVRMREQPDDPVAVFGIGLAEELLRATLMGYCLSIQALWENQIRRYLQRCAYDLKKEATLQQQIPRATWRELDAIFLELRGVPLTAFDEYRNLNLLQLLGNVCRHGNGSSLHRLTVEYPELWAQQLIPAPPPLIGSHAELVRTAENLKIPLSLLKSLVAAIDSFWRETEYIYKESIERKVIHWRLC